MKRKKIRDDLISKMEYSKAYNVSRVTIDKMIDNGELAVEVISNKDYIILKQE